MKLLSQQSLLVLVAGAIAVAVPPVPGHIQAVTAQVMPQRSTVVANNPAIADLAAHLRRVGVRMYGAFWCPHCTRQKELFGNAFKSIDYVECDPRGENPRPKLCQDAGVKGYPTWEIRGKKLVGVQSLEELAEASNFKGSRKF